MVIPKMLLVLALSSGLLPIMKALLRTALLCVVLVPAAAAGQPSELKVTVSLERADLLALDSTRAHIWITNASAQRLDSLYLDIFAPRFISYAVDGRPAAPGERVWLRPLAARATADYHVLLRTGKEVEEGDAALAFVVGARRLDGGAVDVPTVVILEKKLEVGLLGNEAVGGVSLRLMALLLPGLLFFLVARLAKVGWAKEVGETESAVLGVIGSVLLFGALALVWPPEYRSGISILRFLVLCLIAAVLSLAAVTLDRRMARWRARFLIEPTDGADVALEKLLRRRQPFSLARFLGKKPPANAAVAVKTAGKCYVGSLAGAAADGRVAVLAWFRIMVPRARTEVLSELQALATKGDFVELLRAARDYELDPAVYQTIKDAPHGDGILRLEKKDVVSIIKDPAGAPRLPPLTVAEQ